MRTNADEIHGFLKKIIFAKIANKIDNCALKKQPYFLSKLAKLTMTRQDSCVRIVIILMNHSSLSKQLLISSPGQGNHIKRYALNDI